MKDLIQSVDFILVRESLKVMNPDSQDTERFTGFRGSSGDGCVIYRNINGRAPPCDRGRKS